MTLPQTVVGVDVSKNWIDAFSLPKAQAETILTTPDALQAFAGSLSGSHVIFEASGGYERSLAQALDRAGVAYSTVNPRHAREFARACGQLAKADRVDAKMLARMGIALSPRITPPVDPNRERLAALVARRDDHCGMLQAEKNRLAQARDRVVRQDIQSHIRVLTGRITRLESEIATQTKASETLQRDSARLQTMPGLGPVLAPTILATLPELGRLSPSQIASLAGLAPHACDSGLSRGKRRIWGGRERARRALYRAAFIASRFDPRMRAFRKNLEDRGKPTKVALVACARKLLTILNAMLRDAKDYNAEDK